MTRVEQDDPQAHKAPNATLIDCRYHFRGSVRRSEQWRALDYSVAEWVRCHHGSPLLARLAAEASLADARGDSAIRLSRLGSVATTQSGVADAYSIVLSEEQLAQLSCEPLVGDGSEPDGIARPFVLDVAGRFYLRRNYRHESRVVEALADRLGGAPQAHSCQHIPESWLAQLFQGQSEVQIGAQRLAVSSLVGKRLFVLTGGPGTGKTTTVLRMLMVLLRQHAESRRDAPAEPLEVRISAPTGKAAQRLAESLRVGCEALFRGADDATTAGWRAALEQIATLQATTLHRLLGARGHAGGFTFHELALLNADVVVVDEASMMDLALLRALLDALKPQACLILVGDADQLSSVATGSVLLDLVEALEQDSGLSDHRVRLQHSFRADSALLAFNDALRRGDQQVVMAQLSADNPALRWHPLTDVASLHGLLQAWADRLAAAIDTAIAAGLSADGSPSAKTMHALRSQQLLCALREGEFGASAVNAQLDARLARSRDAQGEWYPGRMIMVRVNDYGSGLFNGDIGVCLADPEGVLRVHFETDADATGMTRAFAPSSLPAHSSAWALTIHKSQGSEYDQVAVLLPPGAQHRILSRQLLYTAVTRARHQVTLWSDEASLQHALATRVSRRSGLRERLLARQ